MFPPDVRELMEFRPRLFEFGNLFSFHGYGAFGLRADDLLTLSINLAIYPLWRYS